MVGGGVVVGVVGTESGGTVPVGGDGGDDVTGPVVLLGGDGSVLGGATVDVVESLVVGVTVGDVDEPTLPELDPVPLDEAPAMPPVVNMPVAMPNWALI